MSLPDFSIEKKCWNKGLKHIAGVDEVGRGSLAGPVVAAAVVFKNNQRVFEGVNDSKILSHQKRVDVMPRIVDVCVSWAVGFANVSEIDGLGIVRAVDRAMVRAVRGLPFVDHVLVDGNRTPINLDASSEVIVKGDRKSFSISAASIVAKVIRDDLLVSINELHPEYGFSQHKGYGTQLHRMAIEKYGASIWHRRTFIGKYIEKDK